MQPLVQSAIGAANRGDNNNALELCKQALAADPNDVDAWLVTASVVDQPERKRQCLHRVLSLDPTNRIARDELLEMDRAALGGASRSEMEFASPPSKDPTGRPASTPKANLEKPLIIGLTFVQRLTMFVVILFIDVVMILLTWPNPVILVFLAMASLFGIFVIQFSPTVEITETYIRTLPGIAGGSYARWDEIESMQYRSRGLDLIKRNGQTVNISMQVSGYPRIVEIIRQKRPDLFHTARHDLSGPGDLVASGEYEQDFSNSDGSQVRVGAFPGTRVFRKSLAWQFGISLFIIMIFSLPVVLLGLIGAESLLLLFGAIPVGVVGTLLMGWSLFTVSAIKVEPNKLTMETFFTRKEFRARQIKNIKLKSTLGEDATSFVIVVPVKGRKYSLSNFPEREEIIYAFLMNWWETYRNR